MSRSRIQREGNDPARPVLEHVTWRIAPGERTGILGVNGAGKSTLLGLVAGTVLPTAGRVKRGKTIKVATLSQQLLELGDVEHERVSTVIGRQRTSYVVGGKEVTPGQLLERLGFTSAQLSTPVKDLSGGQRRRLQLLMILLDEPNVLILDEPTNDLDTDMLAAIEDLLDSFPGTLIVVSHDRYLVERVTDQQYAVLGGKLRHLPRGVDEYLELRAKQKKSGNSGLLSASGPSRPDQVDALELGAKAISGLRRDASADARPGRRDPDEQPRLSGAEKRNAEKELAAATRKMEKLGTSIALLHERMAVHDHNDFAGLSVLMEETTALESELAVLETRWLELTELLG